MMIEEAGGQLTNLDPRWPFLDQGKTLIVEAYATVEGKPNRTPANTATTK